jgi:hypothetical protein
MSQSAAIPEVRNVIDYDALYADYLASLIDTLRGFSAKVPGLELWVPDENLLVSLANLLDSATSLGRAAVALQLSAATLQKVDTAELLQLAGRFGVARLDRLGSACLLSVSELGGARRPVPAREPRSAALAGSPAASCAAVEPAASPRAATAAAPVLPDLHLPALERCEPLSVPVIDGDAVASPTRLEATHAGCRLVLEVSSAHTIQSAWAEAEQPLDARLLAELCRIVCGLPLLEACYHGAIRLEHRLRPTPTARALPGIALPRAVHPRFALVESLLGAALARYRHLTGFSEISSRYDARPARAWLEASAAERQALLERALSEVLPRFGLAESDVSVASIRYDVRVELAFGEAWRRFDQPRLVRDLEAELRERVDARLEIYVEELRDKNKLRRLAVVEDPR